MPLCGFNEKMLNGLKEFHLGLVEYGIIERSEKKNQTVQETIKKELEDMERFLKEINNIKNPELRETLRFLTEYAQAFYKLIDKKGIHKYKEIIRYLDNIYFEMDRKYYSELEGQKDDMKKLTIYLEEVGGRNGWKV